MDESSRKQLYNMVWEQWGAETQLDMLIEEMAELTQAILKARRNGVTYSYSVFEELADVMICIEQVETRMKDIKMKNGVETMHDWVTHIRDTKVDRLLERLLDSLAQSPV